MGAQESNNGGLMAKGTFLGLMQPKPNEPWTITIVLRPKPEREPREPGPTNERDEPELHDDE
jgi:hypothetical protein